MNLLQTINELLRDRRQLYETAKDAQGLWRLCGKLLLIFVLTTGLYGAVMGGFRCIHPTFYFSNYELAVPGQTPIRGKVEGLKVESRAIYTLAPLPTLAPGATVRFNLSRPSEAYTVAEIGREKGYGKIVLTSGSVLEEGGAWTLPILVALKTPLLFILTLLVCALALYALNLAFGMNLHFIPTMTVMLFGLAGTGVLLAVFAPIALLFTVVTTSYHFMKMLHMLVFVIAGAFGVMILGEALAGLQTRRSDAAEPPAIAHRRPNLLLLAWLVLYCLVGSQFAWTLKPFLGTPYLPDTPPFRIESGNIFLSTLESGQAIGERIPGPSPSRGQPESDPYATTGKLKEIK